jgi:hypothetical protein
MKNVWKHKEGYIPFPNTELASMQTNLEVKTRGNM